MGSTPKASPRGSAGPRLRRRLAGALLLLAIAPAAVPDAPPQPPKAVLIVQTEDPHLPWVAGLTAGLYAVLEAAPLAARPDIYVEHLDLNRFPEPGHARARAAWLLEKYRGRRIDAILAVQQAALDFVSPLSAELWPGVPVVLVENERMARDLAVPPGVASVLARFDVNGTLDLAKALVPGTRRVAWINGAPEPERAETELFRRDLAARGDGLDLIDLSGLPMAELQRRVASLPSDAVVFYWGLRVDGAGRSFVPREALALIAPHSNRPIFGAAGTLIGYGVVGGRVLDFEALGRAAGGTVLEILGGTPVSSIPPDRGDFSRAIFDDRELRRFHIAAGRLPAGSEVRFREPTLWSEHPRTIAAVAVALLLQGALIVALLFERRRHAEARALTGATLASLPGQVAVLDGEGRIVQVNENWATFGADFPDSPAGGAAIGTDYFEAWRRASGSGGPGFPEAIELIGQVLRGGRENGSQEYALREPGGGRWFEMRVEVLRPPARGAVVVQVDVTGRREAAEEARRREREVAHLNRVGAVGELASSLAHELNQPLAAILTNAQAARRLLTRESPDLEEVRASLNDIIEDDQRAGDVIHRIRSLLRKESVPRSEVDLNEVVRRVVLLVAGDAHLRKTAVELELATALPPVQGDRVQLKQVVLNLLVNGFDAVADRPPSQRHVRIRTEAANGNVVVSVTDSGRGVAPQDLARVFEPFYTTKAEGLGMGLPICRTIVEAHHGELAVESVPGQGATFRCVIPVSPEGAA